MQQATKYSRAPQPIDYLDARKFLEDYMEFRKATERSFSYAKWARELGFSSRSFLRLILVGKRSFTESSIYRIADGLKLKAKEHEYFTLLVKLNQAKVGKERERYAEAMAKIFPASSHAKILDNYKFLSSHHCPRILDCGRGTGHG